VRASFVHPIRFSVLTAALLTAIAACTETPTTVGVGNDDAGAPAFASVDDKKFKPTFHIARVKSDGTLVDGTAVSSSRFSAGVYLLSFPPPIDKCAASANSASFQGFDASVFRVTAQISIGFGAGGSVSDTGVIVSFFSTSDGSSQDTSFTITLVCP
jgi:hypothetical protein